jgi:hypothetical protein
MSPLRLVAALILTACASALSAQSSAPPQASISNIRVPAYSGNPLFKDSLTTQAPVTKFQTPNPPHAPAQMAENDAPCYKIRSSHFTPKDLESSNPRPSSSSTCTPPSGNLRKNADATATK